jgi:hypothetical protein
MEQFGTSAEVSLIWNVIEYSESAKPLAEQTERLIIVSEVWPEFFEDFQGDQMGRIIYQWVTVYVHTMGRGFFDRRSSPHIWATFSRS